MAKQNDKKEQLRPGGVREEVFLTWKKEHGKIRCWKTNYEGRELVCYTYDPPEDLLALAMAKAKESLYAAGRVILGRTWLGGDDEIMAVVMVKIGMAMKLSEHYMGGYADFELVEL